MRQLYYYTILKSIFVVISAIIGAVSTFSIKIDHHKLCSLISLSAGALLGAAAFAILPEAVVGLNILEIILSLISGYFVFWLISKYYFHVCPACSASHFDEQTTKKFSEIAFVMMTALAFHSFFDGIALTIHGNAVIFENNSIFLAILIHKFPEGLALASLMLGANYPKKKIILNVIFVELTTVVGALIGIFLVGMNITDLVFGVIMAHIAGGFVYLAFHAILGEMLKHHTKLVITYFSLGMILILVTRLLTNAL
ncbi:MAG: ZIP family metal transporter [Ignavibacteriales bacterium]|nr:ZIP family metal transporter [Ignavibacteriales bacterium]